MLRCEAIVHNTKRLPCGRSLPKFPQVSLALEHILQRFLEVLDCVDRSFIGEDGFENLSQPGSVAQKRVAGIDLNKPRMRVVMEAVVALSATPKGFNSSAFAVKVREIQHFSPAAYRPRHASYDLKKLHGMNWVHIVDKSRSYTAHPEGLRAMTDLLVLREKILKLVLVGTKQSPSYSQPARETQLDVLYRTIQTDLQNLFHVLGIAILAP